MQVTSRIKQAHQNARIFKELLGGNYHAYLAHFMRVCKAQSMVGLQDDKYGKENYFVDLSSTGKSAVLKRSTIQYGWTQSGLKYTSRTGCVVIERLGRMSGEKARIKALYNMRINGYNVQVSDIGLGGDMKNRKDGDYSSHGKNPLESWECPFFNGNYREDIRSSKQFDDGDLIWQFDYCQNRPKYKKYLAHLTARLEGTGLICEFEGQTMSTKKRDSTIAHRQKLQRQQEEDERYERERTAEIARLKSLVHLGIVGEYFALDLTIVDTYTFEGNWGISRIWKLEDENGNRITKFGKINKKYVTEQSESFDASDLSSYKGSKVSFLAEVKKHESRSHDFYPVQVKSTLIGKLKKSK